MVVCGQYFIDCGEKTWSNQYCIDHKAMTISSRYCIDHMVTTTSGRYCINGGTREELKWTISYWSCLWKLFREFEKQKEEKGTLICWHIVWWWYYWRCKGCQGTINRCKVEEEEGHVRTTIASPVDGTWGIMKKYMKERTLDLARATRITCSFTTCPKFIHLNVLQVPLHFPI